MDLVGLAGPVELFSKSNGRKNGNCGVFATFSGCYSLRFEKVGSSSRPNFRRNFSDDPLVLSGFGLLVESIEPFFKSNRQTT